MKRIFFEKHRRNVLLLGVVSLLSIVAFGQEFNAFDKDGKRHGKWQKKYEGSSQLRYQGTFEHGKEVGEFKFYKPNSGDKPTAIKYFSKESDSVLVKYFTSTGKVVSQGNMIGKNREGKWTYFHKDVEKIMMTEFYIAGKMNGAQKTYFPNGALTETTFYKDDKKEGERKVFSEKGKLLKYFTYVNDLMHGEVKFYDGEGNLKIEGFYKKGKKDGLWKYYENGKLKEEKKFPYYKKKKS